MYGNKFKEATKSLMSYCREQMGYDKDPDVHYVTDSNNANNMLGYTAHYQPDKRIVTVYISNRHPKDVLRSLSHELVHHAQNCRGDLQSAKTEEGYAQNDPHMRKMEEEAYLQGNMMFRDWEDSCKAQNMILPSTIGEQKMSNLRNLIKEKIMEGLLAEKKKMPMKTDTEDLDGDGKTDDKIPAFVTKKQKKSKGGEIPDQLKPHVKAKQGKKEDKEEEKLEESGCASRKGDPRVRRQEPDRLREEEDIEEISYYDGTHDKPIDHKDAEKKVRSMMNMFRDEIMPTLQALGEEFGKGQGNLGGEALKGLDDVYNVFLKINYPGKYKNLEEMGEGRRYKDADPDKKYGSMGDDHDRRVKDAADKKKKDELDAARERFKRAANKQKKVRENELTDVKTKQDSINRLNENRLANVNKELMRRLLK